MIEAEAFLEYGRMIENAPMKDYTTYRLEGTIRLVIFPSSLSNLINLMKFLKEKKIRHKLLGGGSNIIFATNFYDGVIICLKDLKAKSFEHGKLEVESGNLLTPVALEVSKQGYTGLEFATGIPGTIGGAIYNNSGAYQGEIFDSLVSVTVLTPTLEVKKYLKEELSHSYRTSFFKENPGYVILSSTFLLEKGDAKTSMDLIEDRRKRRMMSQPLNFPSAGSVFRNPEGISVWKIIEDLNLKGYQIGDACVSEKHANFIVNVGHAKGSDVVALIYYIQKKVQETLHIELVLEQEIVE